ncbi:hypothetical protein VTK26DRAFT_27 [Humicola hyalothermophila]
MSQSPPSEPPKAAATRPSKRKGTRSVSSLTPQQLTRKRANDREAQRAIRLRTRQHIEHLEQTVKDFQNKKLQERLRDQELQRLLERNKQLEREVAALREGRSCPVPGMSFSPTPEYRPAMLTASDSGFDVEGVSSTASSVVSGRTPPVAPIRPEYSGQPPPLGPSYLPTPEPCEAWPTTVVPASSAVTVPSGVSSPCSSAGPGDEYVASYIPMSVPSSMMGAAMMPNTSASCLGNGKGEYEELETATDQGYSNPAVSQNSPTYVPHQQSWNIYPGTAYF